MFKEIACKVCKSDSFKKNILTRVVTIIFLIMTIDNNTLTSKSIKEISDANDEHPKNYR